MSVRKTRACEAYRSRNEGMIETLLFRLNSFSHKRQKTEAASEHFNVMIILGLLDCCVATPFKQTHFFWQDILSNTP